MLKYLLVVSLFAVMAGLYTQTNKMDSLADELKV